MIALGIVGQRRLDLDKTCCLIHVCAEKKILFLIFTAEKAAEISAETLDTALYKLFLKQLSLILTIVNNLNLSNLEHTCVLQTYDNLITGVWNI